jgi:hypothetical protein
MALDIGWRDGGEGSRRWRGGSLEVSLALTFQVNRPMERDIEWIAREVTTGGKLRWSGRNNIAATPMVAPKFGNGGRGTGSSTKAASVVVWTTRRLGLKLVMAFQGWLYETPSPPPY